MPLTICAMAREKYKCFQKGWKEFNVSDPNEKFDAVILGSDEIWNAGNSAFKNPLFYGVGANSNKIISYSSSHFGNSLFSKSYKRVGSQTIFTSFFVYF